MLNINIQINDKAFEDALAKSITLSDGDDLSKEITIMILADLKAMANKGVDTVAEKDVKTAIEAATVQAKANFEVLIETVKPKVKG